jgi:hypothetical protein
VKARQAPDREGGREGGGLGAVEPPQPDLAVVGDGLDVRDGFVGPEGLEPSTRGLVI